MLQQTRVAAVLPYYERFLARFPTARALARAPEAEVLKYWAGLGYYSRARLLHRAAMEIVERHRGRFPQESEVAQALPGVGRYTAAAVLSIAYDVPMAALDGNVARVLARLGATRGDLRAPKKWLELQRRADELLDVRAPREWNQAMMELGAEVCTPRSPACTRCPVSAGCRAYALGIGDSLPEKRKKRPTVSQRIAAAVLLDSARRTLLLRGAGGNCAGIFSRMWQFPAVEVKRAASLELRQHLRKLLGIERTVLEELPPARHTVTYRKITLLPFLALVERLPAPVGQAFLRVLKPPEAVEGQVSAAPTADARRGQPGKSESQQWAFLLPSLAQVEALPTSSATRKIARAALRRCVGS